MSAGGWAALVRAGQVLWRQPLVWLPAVLVEAPLLLLLVATARALFAAAATVHELHRAALIFGLLLVAALVVAAWADGIRVVAADQELRAVRSNPTIVLDRAAGLAGSFLGVPALIAGLSAALVVTQLLLGLWLVSGGRLDELLTLRGEDIVAGWVARGWIWVLGCVLLLALAGAARELVRLGGIFWRAALVAEEMSAWAAVRQAVRFGYGRGWLLVGRWLLRSAVSALALLGPYLAFAPLLAGAANARAESVTMRLVAATWIGTTAVAWTIARTWLAVADLVLYRVHGGADGNGRLVTRGVRTPRRRVAPRPRGAGVLTIASEPNLAAWRPLPVSEPREDSVTGRQPGTANEQ